MWSLVVSLRPYQHQLKCILKRDVCLEIHFKMACLQITHPSYLSIVLCINYGVYVVSYT